MSRTTKLKLLTVSTAVLAPWLLTSAVVDAQLAPVPPDSDNFAPTAAITVSFHHRLNSFDISFVDPAIGLYVLGDRTLNAVDMVDTHQNLFLGFCGQGAFTGATGNNNTSGPDGVLIRDSREIWAGDGNSTVKVFDVAGCGPGTKPKQIIATGTPHDLRADEMCYDPVDQLIMVANNAASPFPFATLISTAAFPYTVVKRITFDGNNGTPKSTNGIEQCQWSPVTGKFYITVPGVKDPDDGTGVVVQINPDGTVANIFKIDLTLCDTPQGMAIGPDNQILIGCNGQKGSTNKSSVIINGSTGCGMTGLSCVAVLANQSGPDEVWFNEGNGHYFLAKSGAANGGQITQALGIVDAFSHASDTDINVGPVNNPPHHAHPNAHSVAADSVTNKTFFPIPGGLSTLCGSVGGHDTLGCILVVQGKNDEDDASPGVAAGAPVTAVVGGTPTFMRGR